jgi:ATP-binding cassette subfamily F protein 3
MDNKQPEKPKRRRRFPYRKVEDLEADVAKSEREIAELETSLVLPDVYRNANKMKATTRAIEECKAYLAQLYEHWEEAAELN